MERALSLERFSALRVKMGAIDFLDRDGIIRLCGPRRSNVASDETRNSSPYCSSRADHDMPLCLFFFFLVFSYAPFAVMNEP